MKRVILSSEETYDIVLESINSDEMDLVNKLIESNEFNDNVKFLPCNKEDIYSIGNTNELNEATLKQYIHSKDDLKKNFWCHQKHEFSKDKCTNLHESATSSFYCALEILSKPKYAVIYRKEKLQLLSSDVGTVNTNTKCFPLDCKIEE